jgi:DNA mismatch repair protein PMS2
VSGNLRDNLVTVFGAVVTGQMCEVDLPLGETTADSTRRLRGFVSRAAAGCGRASGDRQFFFLNGRPVELGKMAKLINEVYRSINATQCPMVVLDLTLPTDAYDINVTPDKRKVFLHDESALLAALRTSLTDVYEPSRSTFALQDPTATTAAGQKGGKGAARGSGGGKRRRADDGGTVDEADEGSDAEATEEDHSPGVGGRGKAAAAGAGMRASGLEMFTRGGGREGGGSRRGGGGGGGAAHGRRQ